MMDIEKNGTLQYSLDLWANMMGNDFSELRRMWYPAHTPGLSGSRVVNDDAWEDLEDSFENTVVLCVDGAIKSLTATQRGALDKHLNLTSNWYFYALAQSDIPPAFVAYITRQGMATGLPNVATARRVTDEMIESFVADRYQTDVKAALQKVWLALLSNGCANG